MKFIVFPLFLIASNAAYAGCELVSGPCSTDGRGNTYVTQQNLGGGYTTTRNGNYYSNTEQTLSGSYKTEYGNGDRIFHNQNPYERSTNNNFAGQQFDSEY